MLHAHFLAQNLNGMEDKHRGQLTTRIRAKSACREKLRIERHNHAHKPCPNHAQSLEPQKKKNKATNAPFSQTSASPLSLVNSKETAAVRVQRGYEDEKPEKWTSK